MTIAVRGMQYEGRQFLLYGDVILWLALVGEDPDLTKGQRRLVEELINTLRDAASEDRKWSDHLDK